MKKILVSIFVLISLAACSKPAEVAAPDPSKSVMPSAKSRTFLAYEHSLSMEVEEEKMAAIFEISAKVCHDAADDACTVLESRLSTGRYSNAFIKIRAQPKGIKKVMDALSKKAQVVEQSTTAEDLAAPIADGAKKLAMLKDYRANLESLRGRANNDVEALIKVSRELAQVQSELEAAEGKQAFLVQRGETEILKINIHPLEHHKFWRPIGSAFSDFGGDLSRGISSVITGLAYILPWLFVFLFAIWGGRKLWRWWKK